MSTVYAAKTVEGSTEQMIFKLLADGSPVNLTGKAVSLILGGCDGTSVTTTGDVTVTDATTGKVGYTPDPLDFLSVLSPYRARFKVVGGDVVYYHPNTEQPALIYVAPIV